MILIHYPTDTTLHRGLRGDSQAARSVAGVPRVRAGMTERPAGLSAWASPKSFDITT